MRYYAITNTTIAIGSYKQLERYYNDILPLPADYDTKHYIVVDGKLVVDENADKISKIEALDQQYNSDKAVLMSQYTEADILEDFELKASIKVELATLQAEYDRAYEKIVGGEE